MVSSWASSGEATKKGLVAFSSDQVVQKPRKTAALLVSGWYNFKRKRSHIGIFSSEECFFLLLICSEVFFDIIVLKLDVSSRENGK